MFTLNVVLKINFFVCIVDTNPLPDEKPSVIFFFLICVHLNISLSGPELLSFITFIAIGSTIPLALEPCSASACP